MQLETPVPLTNDGSEVIARSVNIQEDARRSVEHDFEDFYEINRCVDWINKFGSKKVGLQFPNSLLPDGPRISHILQKRIESLDVYLLADTTYAPCCVDEVAAKHKDITEIIHFGRACLSRPTSVNVLFIFGKRFLEADTIDKFEKEIRQECSETEKTFWIFYDFMYFWMIDDLQKRLSNFENIFVASIRDVNNKSDICKTSCGFVIPEELPSKIIYFGPESDHLLHIFMNFPQVDHSIFNPQCPHEGLTLPTVRISRKLGRRYYLVEMTKNAEKIGLVCTTNVEFYLDMLKHLQELIKAAGKISYIISVGKPNEAKLGNFPDMDVFVMIACPLTTLYDSMEEYRQVVSPFDVELALNPSCEWTGGYTTMFSEILKHEIGDVEEEEEVRMSLIDGKIYSNKQNLETNSTENLSLVPLESGPLVEVRQQKNWYGLNPEIGLTEVAQLQDGLSGIASGYNEHRDTGMRAIHEIIDFTEHYQFPSAEFDYPTMRHHNHILEEGKEDSLLDRDSDSMDDVFDHIPPIPRNVSTYDRESGDDEMDAYEERTASRNSYESEEVDDYEERTASRNSFEELSLEEMQRCSEFETSSRHSLEDEPVECFRKSFLEKSNSETGARHSEDEDDHSDPVYEDHDRSEDSLVKN